MARNRDNSAPYETATARLLEIALILLVFFVEGGAPVPHNNEAHYLAKAKHYWNPDWCAGDLFLESADPHLFFYWTVGLLTKWFSLPTVAWLGRIVAWMSLAWAWQRLSWQIVPVKYLSVVTAMLLVTLIAWGNFAGEWVVGGVEGKCFAYVFVFWGLAELARGNWRQVWPLLGIASAWHVLVGGWSVLAALAVWGIEDKESRPSFYAMLPTLILGGLLALPGVIPGLMLSIDVPDNVKAEANQIYVFERLPHHLAPLTLPVAELLLRTWRFGLLLAMFLWLWRACGRLPSRSLLQLVRVQRFAGACVVFGALGLAWEVATWNHFALSASLLKFYWFRMADIAVPLAISLSAAWLFSMVAHRRSHAVVLAGIFAIVVPAALLLNLSINRGLDNTAPSDSKLSDRFAWQEACGWAKENTPKDTLFLIPRHGQSFKCYAGRPDYFNWKDVPQDPASIVEWFRRNREIYSHTNEWGKQVSYRSLGELGTDRIREIASQHGIDFIIANEYPPLGLPVVFENDWFKIYRSTTKGSSPPPEEAGSITTQ
ncbi:DUF6798 domain-containing protein [Bythopirellula polymerisocia]|uniref:DUF6798 domain-containing protein n=1 Tax=Bythopirellula polymerisocia TaxID=2528003 RepID=A0A5C6CMP5_9BACT|nr:DUF6798 domain-containing protein [Bythopirellula polymerisocia]TWU25652.1 hypothetical protein Pla144_28610 [Bythopirellula polymerisocia]